MPKVEVKGTFALSLPPSTVERLDRVAKREDRSRSSAVRRAIDEYLEKREQSEDRQQNTIAFQKEIEDRRQLAEDRLLNFKAEQDKDRIRRRLARESELDE